MNGTTSKAPRLVAPPTVGYQRPAMFRRPAQPWLSHPLAPWAGLLLLNLLLLLPAQALPVCPFTADSGWREIFVFGWLAADLLAVVGVLWLGQRFHRPRLAISLATLAWLIALAFESYDIFIITTFSRPAVLYNDLLLLPDALNLLLDLAPRAWPLLIAVVLVAAAATTALACTAVARGLGRVHQPRRLALALAGASLLLAVVHLERGLAERDSIAQSGLMRLTANLDDSVAMRAALVAVASGPASDPTPRSPALSGVVLRSAPSLVVVMVESYGSVLNTDPTLAPGFAPIRARFAQQLVESGWRVATGTSDSPVTGGMSWLASATLLGGLELSNQHLYQRFISQPQLSMPAFFASQGYRTLTVQPANRERPGRPLGNPYGFDQVLFRDELAYEGPAHGWGVVPDQFSLNLVLEAAAEREGPSFIYAVTVSSHAPWTDLPTVVENWRSLNREPGERISRWQRLGEKLRARLGFEEAPAQPEAYLTATAYELEVLGRLIADQQPGEPFGDAVFVLVGDHQPPFFDARGDPSTPVHVITRDPDLLSHLAAYGFAPGLDAAPPSQPHLRHAGLFTLLARSFVTLYGADAAPPPYQPEGTPLSVLYPR